MKNLVQNPTVTPQGQYLTKVVIYKDRQYSQSYNTSIQDPHSFDFARVEGDWVHVWSLRFGYQGKHKISAKHFRGMTFGKAITERAFNMRNKKMQNQIAEEKAQEEADRLAAIQARGKAQEEAKSNLDNRIKEVIDNIKAVVSKEIIEQRLSVDKSNNQPCNQAVGMVGYQYAKLLGWTNVLSKINEYYV